MMRRHESDMTWKRSSGAATTTTTTVCMHEYMCTCLDGTGKPKETYVCMYVYMHVCIYACMHICIEI